MDYKQESFIRLFVRFFLVFLVLFTIFKLAIGIFQAGSIEGMIDANFGEEHIGKFLKVQFSLSLFYGLFMAGYYKFIKK
jgi:hypothetical protein